MRTDLHSTPLQKTLRGTGLLLATLAVILSTKPSSAQNVPLVSGSLGMFEATNKGKVSFQPTFAPVFAVPLGSHFLAEGRFNLEEFIARDGKGLPYDTTLFKSTQIAQLDYIVNSRLTLVAGESIVPFNTYNERLSEIWQQNFHQAPLIASVGTRDTGEAFGMQARGNAFSSDHVKINYTSWFSKRQDRFSLNGTRSIGDRVEVVLPDSRIEFGASFARRLQDVRYNNYGAHFYWLPYKIPYQVRAEYANGPHSQGYWIENSYRLSQFGGPNSIVGRIEPLFRMQQSFRNSPSGPGPSDGLPNVDTKQADFGLDYNMPHDFRFVSNYSRVFAKGGDGNFWSMGLTYRFLLPAWRERKSK